MPYCHLVVAQPIDTETRRFLARYLTALIADLLNKRAEVTAVRIESAAAEQWFVAGEAPAAGLTAAHATLYITAGTNSEAEKAAFIAQLDSHLHDSFGPMPEAGYIVIQEVAATDWGYAGQTQAARHLKRNSAPHSHGESPGIPSPGATA